MSNTATASATIKTWFETGDIPTQSQFSDFITSYANLVDNNALDLFETSITAHAGGGQGSAYQLTKKLSVIATCATLFDSVKTSTAIVNRGFMLLNSGSTAAAVYPTSGEAFFGMANDSPIVLFPTCILKAKCTAAGVWSYQIVSQTGVVALPYLSQTTPSALVVFVNDYVVYSVTALANAMSIGLPSGAISPNQTFSIVITDNGTPQTLTWNAVYVAAVAPLPLVTVASSKMFFTFQYNAGAGNWYLISYVVEGLVTPVVRRYKALVAQSGTAAPTAVILENTLGEVPTYSRSAAGEYIITSPGSKWAINKTALNIGNTLGLLGNMLLVRISDSQLYLQSGLTNGTGQDNEFVASDSATITIEIYP